MPVYSVATVSAAVSSVLQKIELTSESDKAFLGRVYGEGDLEKYRARLKSIGFVGHECVLDAGCGFGQWSVALSETNAHVVGTDIDLKRIDVSTAVSSELGISNLEFHVTPMDGPDFGDSKFDAIFSYGALPLSPYKKTLKAFHRLLKTGGLLYFSSYDLGWMIYNIVDIHNPATDFDPRQWGIDSIQHTLNYLGGGEFVQRSPRDSLLVPQATVKDDLISLGFEIMSICGDGKTSIFGDFGQEAFFPETKFGLPAVYEVVCRKL